MSGRQTYSQGRPTASAGALAGLLVMASMATACGSPYGAASPQAGDPARSVAQQDGYTITLALVPLAELGLEPPAGALRNLGYRLEVSGPGAVRADMELFLLRLKGCAWSHTTIDHAAFRREPGQDPSVPFGRLTGSIALPEGARPGDEANLLAAAEVPSGWTTSSPPSVWFRLAQDGSGSLVGVPARPTLGLESRDASPDPGCNGGPVQPSRIPFAPTAAATRPYASPVNPATPPRLAMSAATSLAPPRLPEPFRLITPTPSWPRRAQPLTRDEAVQQAANLLPPALYAGAQVSAERGANDVWRVRFAGLHAPVDELRWPTSVSMNGQPRATLATEGVVVEIDGPTGQPLQAEAFADPAGPPETPQPRVEPALPVGKAVIFLLPGSHVRVRLDSGGAATLYFRPLGDEELRAWGFTIVRSAVEFERAAGDARVLWIHRDAAPLVDPAWFRARYEEGLGVGMLDGAMSELGAVLGVTLNEPSMIQPGSLWPVFALRQQWQCQLGASRSGGSGGSSDWLSLSWLISVSQRALEDPCNQGR